MATRKKAPKKKAPPIPKNKPKCKVKHSFTYYGGEAPCVKCGWFLQPDGKITRRP